MLLGQNVNSYGKTLETPVTFAEVIAAKHYADSCFEGVFAGSWHALYDLIGFLPDINDLVVGLQRPVKKLREFVDMKW